MIILKDVVGFDWDEGNSRKSDRHDVSMAEAEQVFFSPSGADVARLGALAGRAALPRPRKNNQGKAIARYVFPSRKRQVDPCGFGARHEQKGTQTL